MTNYKQLINYIQNKKLLIVGGGPSASNKLKKWYDSFDIVVRLNNYKMVNSDRTDIYFSYFGRNIKKTKEELLKNGVKFLINKCPNENVTELDANDKIQMHDYRWIYDLRKDWWFKPLISLTKEELLYQIDLLDGYMPTIGLSAILFFIKYIKIIHIIGFDCFQSGIHNLNEKWDGSGGHNIKLEKKCLKILENKGDVIWHK